jgi:hypothetical protein
MPARPPASQSLIAAPGANAGEGSVKPCAPGTASASPCLAGKARRLGSPPPARDRLRVDPATIGRISAPSAPRAAWRRMRSRALRRRTSFAMGAKAARLQPS